MPAEDRNAQKRLKEYREKRRAGETPEPFPGGAQRPGQFVVHLHDATRRHYDLRLETGGVLRSWAVPNGPSLDPADKRLAVETEDHPVEYLDFEDVIPEGNYGAGPMIVWDRGRWVPREDDQTGDNKLLFDLYGHKLRGRWTLVRTKRSPKEWLLIKKVDGYAREGEEATLPEESVYSGLTVEELGEGASPAEELAAELDALGAPEGRVNAATVDIMLAQTAERAFTREGWLFELKYDGYRLVAGLDGKQVLLRYRNGGDATEVYPDLVPALRALPFESLVLDGEVVVLADDGRPSFSKLARRARLSRESDIVVAATENPATLFAFDLLELDGRDLRGLPLHERKRILSRVVPERGPVRYSDHFEGRGEVMFEQVQRLGLEGLVAKKADAPYRDGRSDAWLKIRADRHADFVIVGTARGKGSRESLGALLLALHTPEGFVYVGRVGTGFRDADLDEIRQVLDPLALPAEQQKEPPLPLPDAGSKRYANLPKPGETTWVRPELACEVRFKEVTDDGLLRHPVFLRLRPDKPVHECDASQPALRHAEALAGEDEGDPPASVRGVVGEGTPGQTAITRPDKVFWPDEGYTKGDLIDYYRAVSPYILPYLHDRPLVLDRYPDGITGNSFFQKHAPHFTPEWIRTVTIHSTSGERDIDYFVVESEEALVYMANSGGIPLHVWSGRVATLDTPDWTILDLDPKEAPFSAVVEVAREIKKLCDQIGLSCYPKTSGKTGLHVLVPLGRQVSWEHGRMIADLLALIVSRRLPEISTVARSLHARGDKVYIDAVQNGAGRLLVAPLCVRPVPGARVSTPLRWSEVNGKLDPGRYTIKTVPARLKRQKSDPMLPILDEVPDLLAALEKLSEIERTS